MGARGWTVFLSRHVLVGRVRRDGQDSHPPFRQHTQPSILLVASAHYVHAANNDAEVGPTSSRCRTDTEAACACRKFGAQPVPGGRNYGVQTSKGVPENHFCPPLVRLLIHAHCFSYAFLVFSYLLSFAQIPLYFLPTTTLFSFFQSRARAPRPAAGAPT